MYLLKCKVEELDDGQPFSPDALGRPLRAVRRPAGVYATYTAQDGSQRLLAAPESRSDRWWDNWETVFTFHDMVPDYRRDDWELLQQVDPQVSYLFDPVTGVFKVSWSKKVTWEHNELEIKDQIYDAAQDWRYGARVFDGSRYWDFKDGKMVKVDPSQVKNNRT